MWPTVDSGLLSLMGVCILDAVLLYFYVAHSGCCVIVFYPQWVEGKRLFQEAADLMDYDRKKLKTMWAQFWASHQVGASLIVVFSALRTPCLCISLCAEVLQVPVYSCQGCGGGETGKEGSVGGQVCGDWSPVHGGGPHPGAAGTEQRRAHRVHLHRQVSLCLFITHSTRYSTRI